jgi:hypothetical protein
MQAFFRLWSLFWIESNFQGIKLNPKNSYFTIFINSSFTDCATALSSVLFEVMESLLGNTVIKKKVMKLIKNIEAHWSQIRQSFTGKQS